MGPTLSLMPSAHFRTAPPWSMWTWIKGGSTCWPASSCWVSHEALRCQTSEMAKMRHQPFGRFLSSIDPIEKDQKTLAFCSPHLFTRTGLVPKPLTKCWMNSVGLCQLLVVVCHWVQHLNHFIWRKLCLCSQSSAPDRSVSGAAWPMETCQPGNRGDTRCTVDLHLFSLSTWMFCVLMKQFHKGIYMWHKNTLARTQKMYMLYIWDKEYSCQETRTNRSNLNPWFASQPDSAHLFDIVWPTGYDKRKVDARDWSFDCQVQVVLHPLVLWFLVPRHSNRGICQRACWHSCNFMSVLHILPNPTHLTCVKDPVRLYWFLLILNLQGMGLKQYRGESSDFQEVPSLLQRNLVAARWQRGMSSGPRLLLTAIDDKSYLSVWGVWYFSTFSRNRSRLLKYILPGSAWDDAIWTTQETMKSGKCGCRPCHFTSN